MTLELGRVVITQGALERLPKDDVLVALRRHARCDWGDLTSEDHVANYQAFFQDTRVLSAYHAADGTKFWIITEWDRSLTTVLLPEEY
jgi:hypothetical protein